MKKILKIIKRLRFRIQPLKHIKKRSGRRICARSKPENFEQYFYRLNGGKK